MTEPEIEKCWIQCMKDEMNSRGWTCDRDDEKTLGFSLIEGDKHWIRDYNKKTRRFAQFNANHVVNLRVSKE